MLTLAQTISQSVCSSGMSVLSMESFTAISTPPPVPVLRSFRHSLKLSGKTWLSVIEGSSHVSVAMMISGLVLSMRFSILSCFFLMDWQLTFRILSGGFFGGFFLGFTLLSGVDE